MGRNKWARIWTAAVQLRRGDRTTWLAFRKDCCLVENHRVLRWRRHRQQGVQTAVCSFSHIDGCFWGELRTFPAVTVATKTGILSRTVMFFLTSKPRGSRASPHCDERREENSTLTWRQNSSVVCGLTHDFLLRRRNNHNGCHLTRNVNMGRIKQLTPSIC